MMDGCMDAYMELFFWERHTRTLDIDRILRATKNPRSRNYKMGNGQNEKCSSSNRWCSCIVIHMSKEREKITEWRELQKSWNSKRPLPSRTIEDFVYQLEMVHHPDDGDRRYPIRRIACWEFRWSQSIRLWYSRFLLLFCLFRFVV